jgi:hypothetical protein
VDSGLLPDGAADSPRATDPAADPGSGASVDTLPDASALSCAAEREPCTILGIDVRGESPFGPVQLFAISVSYWNGFTMGTALRARGRAGGRPLELSASVYTLKYESEAVPPGEYRAAVDPAETPEMSVQARLCSDEPIDLRRVQLRVDQHEIPQVVRPGSALRFEGTLTISDPGWSLELPFAIRMACHVDVDV